MKKSFFIMVTLCLCSDGFPQSNSKSNEVGYKEDFLNEGDLEPFVSGLSGWRKFRDYEESIDENELQTKTNATTTPPDTTTITTPPDTTTITTPPDTTTSTQPDTTTITTPPDTTTITTPPDTTTSTPSNTTISTPSNTTISTQPDTTTSPPSSTTPKGNGATAFNPTSFSAFGILFLVHSICKYKYA